ncbi:MAG: hypothetical protein M5U12_01260 [Verrucomicrobia bacterium]|nr:hypothetical protein [Verrucomicrobiota bacterium]
MRGQRILRGHGAYVFTVSFTPDGQRLASGGSDRTVRLWDPASGALLKTLEVARPRVSQVVFGSPPNLLWLRGTDRSVEGLDVGTAEVRYSIQLGSVSVRGMAPHPDGRRVVIALSSDGVRVWDAVAGTQVAAFPGLGEEISELALDPQGRWFALGGMQGAVTVRDSETGETRWQVRAHPNALWRVAFDAAGERLLSVGADGRVRVWAATDGRELLTVVASGSPLRDGGVQSGWAVDSDVGAGSGHPAVGCVDGRGGGHLARAHGDTAGPGLHPGRPEVGERRTRPDGAALGTVSRVRGTTGRRSRRGR